MEIPDELVDSMTSLYGFFETSKLVTKTAALLEGTDAAGQSGGLSRASPIQAASL